MWTKSDACKWELFQVVVLETNVSRDEADTSLAHLWLGM